MNTQKIKRLNAMEYIIYMMIGSYFKSAKCTSKILEQRLFLYYKDMNEKTQIEKETKIINYAENILKKSVGEHIWEEDVLVNFGTGWSKGTQVSFEGKDWSLIIYVDSENINRIHYQYYDKVQLSAA